MNKPLRNISTWLAVILIISGCNPATLKYQLDPEISYLNQLPDETKIVALKVIDARTATSPDNTEQHLVSGPSDEAKILQDKFITQLKQNGLKIISKPLLADIAFEIEIVHLALTLESSTFKSVIRGKSEIKLTANKQGATWSKIFRATREQEVANPANDLDVTGVINQMLTKQFSRIFTDQTLTEFLAKQQ